MDPNTGKKGMFNKLSKQQAIKLLKKENFKRKTVSFYKYVILENPKKLRDDLYADWLELGVLGFTQMIKIKYLLICYLGQFLCRELPQLH